LINFALQKNQFANMNKTVFLSLIGIFLLKLEVNAQELPQIGIFGGYTFPGGVFTDLHDFSYKPVNNAGIFAEFDRLDHLFMNTGIMYSQNETGPITLSPEVKVPKDFSSNMTFNYLQIYGRLKYSYKLVNHVNVYYSAGLYGGYLISGSYTENNDKINATSNMHRGNGGLLGGVGISFDISKLKLNLGADANYGFFYTVKDLPYRGTIYSAGVITSLGISYPVDFE